MSIPKEFQYENEAEFVERFLIPLLQRLGFSMVVNYHGKREFGKDLVFAEVDRLGHIRYYGLQAKYVSNVGIQRMRDLIDDCKQAFENPFRHPQTGTSERIGMFYAVNAGTFSEPACENFFNALDNPYGGNIRLLDGEALLMLDRWATFNRVEAVGERLTGLLLEIRYNRLIFSVIKSRFGQYIAEGGTFSAGFRLRLNAVSHYLECPLLPVTIPTDKVENYWHNASVVNIALSALTLLRISADQQKERMTEILGWEERIETNAANVEAAVLDVLEKLGQPTKSAA